jgi:lipopolysaccharide transport system permease protein
VRTKQLRRLAGGGPFGRPDLVLHLVRSDFAVRYRRSTLGALWSLVQPLSRLVVLSFLFTKILPLGVENYTSYLFVGLIAYTWFSAAVASGCKSPVDRADLILRPGVPRVIVPVVAVLSAGIDYLAALPVLLAYLALTDGVPWTAVILPALLLLQLALTLGISFALAASNVFVRDVRIVTDVCLLLGFYATPVFFTADQVPEQYRHFVTLNPLSSLMEMQRDVLVEGQVPGARQLLVTAAVCLVVGVVGHAVYQRASPAFADEL